MVPGARPPSFDPTTVLIAFEYPASGGQPPSSRGSQRGPALLPLFAPFGQFYFWPLNYS